MMTRVFKMPPAGWCVICCLLLGGCANVSERETAVFGTRVVITINGVSEEQALVAINEVFANFRVMHKRFHAWREGELATVNRAIADSALPIKLSPAMATMLALSADYAERSEHLFNPAIGHLVALWGFHADVMPQKPPPDEKIRVFVANPPTLANINLSSEKLEYIHPKSQLDFGAVAKGVALDEAKKILRRHNIQNALINIGGNIMALGKNGTSPWLIELRPAVAALPVGVVALHDGESIATSGGGERQFNYQGKTYHHILDWRTGEPAVAVAAAIVISDAAENAGAISDAAATALVIADDGEAAHIIESFKINAVLRLFPDGNQYANAQMAARLKEK